MGNPIRNRIKIRSLGLFALASLTLGTSAIAQEPLIVPADEDSYLHSGPVNTVEELDAIRRHLKDLKYSVIFSAGFLGTAIFLHRIL